MKLEAPPDRAAVRSWVVVDGNEAAARVAHRLSEVIAIYPITPVLADGRARRRVDARRAARTSGAPSPR